MDGNDDTTGHCVRGTRCGQVLEPWTGALLKDRVQGIHYLRRTNEWGITFGEQGCGLSIKASTATNFWCLDNRRLSSGAR